MAKYNLIYAVQMVDKFKHNLFSNEVFRKVKLQEYEVKTDKCRSKYVFTI